MIYDITKDVWIYEEQLQQIKDQIKNGVSFSLKTPLEESLYTFSTTQSVGKTTCRLHKCNYSCCKCDKSLYHYRVSNDARRKLLKGIYNSCDTIDSLSKDGFILSGGGVAVGSRYNKIATGFNNIATGINNIATGFNNISTGSYPIEG